MEKKDVLGSELVSRVLSNMSIEIKRELGEGNKTGTSGASHPSDLEKLSISYSTTKIQPMHF